MSVITLFYGQCGSQISDAFYNNLHSELANAKNDDYHAQTRDKWFHVTKSNKLTPRSLLIDTERKTKPRNVHYQLKSVVSKSCGGSANNWAFGYSEQSKLLMSEVEKHVRRELERSDQRASFLNVGGLSGGTGSGVGSAVVEFLKDEFSCRVINAAVLPYGNGEVVTQSYNSLFALSKMYSASDAVVLFENDRLHYTCANSLNVKDVTFDDVNNLIARQILSVFQPLQGVQSCDLLCKLCEDPLFKLLQIKLAPLCKLENASNWKALLTSISRQSRFDYQQKTQSGVNLRVKGISTALICRGLYSPSENDLRPFRDNNSTKTVQVYHQRKKIFNLENCLSVVSNSSNVFIPLYTLLQDGLKLYKYGAYMHHYKKFGLDQGHFKASFEVVERMLQNYKDL